MSTAQYVLNAALLLFVLASNLGTRRLTLRRLLLPLLLVAGAAALFLQHVPTVGNDVQLEAVATAVGAALGVAAGLLVRVHRTAPGTVVTTAGLAYAALWVFVVGGRVLFAYGAEHWFSRDIGMFSRTHQISGADAWAAAFVMMALAMVLVRVLVTATALVRSGRAHREVVSA